MNTVTNFYPTDADSLARRFAAMIDDAAVAIGCVDANGRLFHNNPALEQMLGYEPGEMIGLALPEIIHPEDFDNDWSLLTEMLEGRLPRYKVEERLLRKDHSVIWVRATISMITNEGEPPFAMALIEDITEHKELQLRLQEAQKLEAVGRLAGGVAHEFNNLLTIVLGEISMVAEQLQDRDAVRRLDVVQSASLHGQQLVRQLLAFGRKQIFTPQTFSLRGLVQEIEPELQAILGDAIQIAITGDAASSTIAADRHHIRQLLIELAENSRTAMPAGGLFTIRVQHAQEGDRERVILEVADTGSGIEPDVLPRVFEPFFTTSRQAGSPGLGLSTVHGIVLQSDGHVEVTSTPGAGTCVRISLPVQDVNSESAPPQPELAPTSGGTVLLVDDMDPIRALIRKVLERGGFNVVEASNGTTALMSAESIDRIDLLITDVVMPEMGGLDLARSLRQKAPELPILFISGYTRGDALELTELGGRTVFLEKPFTPSGLLAAVGSILTNQNRAA